MYGHEPLIAMRMRGAAPAAVWIDTDPIGRLNPASDWQEFTPRNAHLQLVPGDKPHRLDLRCVVGLNCHIDGTDRKRVFAVTEACIAAGAKRVMASVTEQSGDGEFPTFRLIEATDTAGEFTLLLSESVDG